MKLYHGTSERHLKKILRDGIVPRGKRKGNWDHSVKSHPDAVYLTKAYSLYYALSATRPTSMHEKGVVFEIDTDKLNPFCLCPDEDFLAQATMKRPAFAGMTLFEVTEWFRNRLSDYSDEWETSINHLGNCCYLGSIPLDAITRYALIGNPMSWLQWSDPTIGILNYAVLGKFYCALSASLFGDSTGYTDTDRHYKLPPPEKLGEVKVYEVSTTPASIHWVA